MLGRTISHYEVTHKLGAGGIGEVYAARDTLLGRTVAVKILQSSRALTEESRSRFLQEARAASALNHPYIVTIYDVVRDGDGDCIVMELVDGETLGARIARGPIPPDDALSIVSQIAEALATAHARGIIHRDLKPANVMLTPSGRVKILDFGLAKLMAAGDELDPDSPTSPRTLAGQLVGTPAYMSPEQIRGEPLDGRSDIFSLGSILFEMLTGRRAFAADSLVAMIHVIAYGQLPAEELRGVPDEVTDLVRRMTARSPEDRIQSAAELRVAAETLRAGGTLELTPRSSRSPAPPGRPRRTTALAALLGVVILATALMLLWQRRQVLPEKAVVAAAPAATMQLPRTAQEHVRYGNQLLATPWRKDFVDKAIEQFQLAVKIDERHASAHAGLSVAYWRKFRQSNDHAWLDRATANAAHAVELDPQLAAAHIALGTAKVSRGELDAAREELNKAVVLDPANASAHRWLAEVAAKSKDREAAEAGFRKAVALRPQEPELLNALGSFLYANARYDEAAKTFQQSIDLAPDNMASYRNLSAVLHQKGDYPGAARVLQRSLELEPNPIAYSNLGTLYFFQGLYPQSVSAFEKAVELGANTHVLWANLGDAYRWTPGNQRKARDAFGTALSLLGDELREQPQDATLLSRKALYLAKQGEAAEASRIADALLRDERDPQNLYRLGLAYELAGARQKSLDALGNAVRRGYSPEELRSDPELTSLRSDVRYHRMMQAVRDRP